MLPTLSILLKRKRWKNWTFLVSVREMLRIILKENSFQLNEKHYIVKNHGTAMSTYSSFLSNIFMAAYIKTQSLSKTIFKPTVWKSYIDDIFSLWDIRKPDMVDFFKFTDQVNLLHPTALLAIKFTAEISDNETIFLDPVVYQRTTFNEKWEKAILDVKTNFKRKPSSIQSFTSYHPPIVKMDLTNKKPWESYEQTPLRKYFRFQNAVDGQRLATQFWKKSCY